MLAGRGRAGTPLLRPRQASVDVATVRWSRRRDQPRPAEVGSGSPLVPVANSSVQEGGRQGGHAREREGD